MRASPEYPRFTRRKALIIGGSSLAYLVLQAKYGFPILSVSTPEAQDLEPNSVESGVWAVYKGINIRTSPRIPDRNRFSHPDNRLSWDEIDEVNGVPLSGKSAFLIINPPGVKGQNTYPEFYTIGSAWIKLLIKKKGEKYVMPYYISDTLNTREFLKPVEWSSLAGKTTDGYKDAYDLVIKENDVGRVIVSENPETMARDIMPGIWSDRVRKRIESGLTAKDKVMVNVKVVAGGTEQDVEEMMRLNTLINVRDYPALKYGNGEQTRIVGGAPQGTSIGKAFILDDPLVYHPGFAAVRSEDIQGQLLDGNGNPFKPSFGKIFAIHSLYLATKS